MHCSFLARAASEPMAGTERQRPKQIRCRFRRSYTTADTANTPVVEEETCTADVRFLGISTASSLGTCARKMSELGQSRRSLTNRMKIVAETRHGINEVG